MHRLHDVQGPLQVGLGGVELTPLMLHRTETA